METKIYLVWVKNHKINETIVIAIFSDENKATKCAEFWNKQFKNEAKTYWVEEETLDRYSECY